MEHRHDPIAAAICDRPTPADTAMMQRPALPDGVMLNAPARHRTKLVHINDFANEQDCAVFVCPAKLTELPIPSVISEEGSYRIQCPAGMPEPTATFPKSVTSPPLYLSRLSNVTCLPGGVAISEDGTLLEEVFSATWEKEQHHHLIKDGGGHRLKQPHSEPVALLGKYLYLDYQHQEHYGHFIADVLSRAWAAMYLRHVFGIDRFKTLITRTATPYILQLLNALGFGPGDIYMLDGPAKVQELFVATKAYQLQEYTSPMTASVWDSIGSYFLNPSDPSRNLYISRIHQPQRPLANERAIEAMFEQRGFAILHPEHHSLAEQIRMICNAPLVAGSGGSNLFTLAFHRRMRSCFVVNSPLLVHLTDLMFKPGADFTYYIGSPNTEHPGFDARNVHAPWIVRDEEGLKRAIDGWLERQSYRADGDGS
jgi:capsular polysaccharide biosynthesis protein